MHEKLALCHLVIGYTAQRRDNVGEIVKSDHAESEERDCLLKELRPMGGMNGGILQASNQHKGGYGDRHEKFRKLPKIWLIWPRSSQVVLHHLSSFRWRVQSIGLTGGTTGRAGVC